MRSTSIDERASCEIYEVQDGEAYERASSLGAELCAMATVKPAPLEFEYLSSDGEPMAETPLHRAVIVDSIAVLSDHFAENADVYVSGNMMMYYTQGNAKKWVSPHVFVTRGIRKLPEREGYQVWREGKGPDVVIEVSSPDTARFDLGRKFDLYRDVLVVPEYFLFGP